jgi:tRNA A37 threonylcarbamoyladenosine dehydratase
MNNRMSATDLTLAAVEPDLARRFGGVARLYGEAGTARLRAAQVVVVGIGGVGSWAAEALARSAVGRLTLVDLDHIAESNTNRQVHALDGEYGKAKVLAMAERIAAINPACVVTAVEAFADAENAASLVAGVDLVIDCTDQVSAKAALIAAARAAKVPIISCGAAGGRVDPTRVRCADLAVVTGDPLLSKVRYRLRRSHGFPRGSDRRPKFHVIGVYSDEPVQRPLVCAGEPDAEPLLGGLACSGYGSSVAVTATIGFVAAGQALTLLARPRKAA